MGKYDRIIQLALLLVAAGLLTTAGILQTNIQNRAETSETSLQNTAVLEANPEIALLTTAFGGLRVLGANYLWIRSQAEHNAGRHYDAYQLAELICELQPYFPGVWSFQSWNMAWNISVKMHTREQRWHWIYSGVKLLRDRGIPLNPKSLELYKELAWIFFSKIGGQVDDMHLSYKQRWAGMMQRLLGAPPVDLELNRTLASDTEVVIETFRPIAEAPLDKDPRLQGSQPGREGPAMYIQKTKQDELLADPKIRAYAEKLAKFNVAVDETLLDAYNYLSLDFAAQAVRVLPPNIILQRQKELIQASTKLPAEKVAAALARLGREEELLTLINADDEDSKYARGKMLAFLRAQILWNNYRLDPAYMLELMENYQAPFDWRHAMPHALYWSSLGMKAAPPEDPSQIQSLNNQRNILNALKNLSSTGLVNLQFRPEQPDYPDFYESADLRYIEPTHRQHVEFIERLEKLTGEPFRESSLASGHKNYLIEAINLLVADGRIVGPDGKAIPGTAQYYYNYLKDESEKGYAMKGGKWDHVSVEDFVIQNLQDEKRNLRSVVVQQLLQYSLKRAFLARGLRGDETLYKNRLGYARRIAESYQAEAVERLKLPPFTKIASQLLTFLLERPRALGADLSISQRSDIYLSMRDQPEILVRVYHRLEGLFQMFCRAEGLDPKVAFPPPPGLKAFREELRTKFQRRPENMENPR
ncbi:MAG: hypothetical protein JW849_07570 [Phycisphaerae bacterium]|nr:hypothetical protein [Phycisphaerae bacterium]